MSETRAGLLPGDDGWVPAACTLPTVEQPVRRREFDDLFTADVVAVVRETPTGTRLELRREPAAASRAAALASRRRAAARSSPSTWRSARGR